MHGDRVFGLCVLAFGVLLLLVLIPAEVASGRGYTDPGRFPRIAAYLFIGLGALHAATAAPGIDLPSPREAVRLVLVFALALLACWVLRPLGYLVTTVALMAALTLMVFERRPVWIVVTTLAVPLALYAFFVMLLERPLPGASLF